MIATDPTNRWRDRVLVLRGWENGFCPLHVLTELQCNPGCVVARLKFEEAARDLEYHWRRLGYRTEIRTQ